MRINLDWKMSNTSTPVILIVDFVHMAACNIDAINWSIPWQLTRIDGHLSRYC